MDETQASRSSFGSNNRKLRYRALLENLSTLEDEGGTNDECMERTGTAVSEAKSLFLEGGMEERVKHPREGYLDSRVLRATSDIVVRCSAAVTGNENMYDRHELAAHIKENPDFWVFPFPKEMSPAPFLFGTFAPTPPEERPRRPRRRLERQEVAQLTEPENVDRLERTEEGSEMVARVNRFINKTYRKNGEKPISYFHMVLDPTSFANTIENIYHVSFLVRDGCISINVDDNVGIPFITPVVTNNREASQRDLQDENQFIISMDMPRWKELVTAFRIKTPMLSVNRS